jgi:hypothetical protein
VVGDAPVGLDALQPVSPAVASPVATTNTHRVRDLTGTAPRCAIAAGRGTEFSDDPACSIIAAAGWGPALRGE